MAEVADAKVRALVEAPMQVKRRPMLCNQLRQRLIMFEEEVRGGGAAFTAEQVQKLLTLIETSTSSHERLSGQDGWLLDSGASCHLTGNPNLLSNVHEASSIHVELPNGETTLATKKGLVHLNSQIVLKDVLYVPQLCCNLISIAQLINDLYLIL